MPIVQEIPDRFTSCIPDDLFCESITVMYRRLYVRRYATLPWLCLEWPSTSSSEKVSSCVLYRRRRLHGAHVALDIRSVLLSLRNCQTASRLLYSDLSILEFPSAFIFIDLLHVTYNDRPYHAGHKVAATSYGFQGLKETVKKRKPKEDWTFVASSDKENVCGHYWLCKRVTTDGCSFIRFSCIERRRELPIDR